MNDFELLSLMLVILGIMVTLIVKYIDAKK